MLPAILAGAAIAGPIIGGIVGNEAARGNREAAERAAREAYAEIERLNAPPDLSKRIILETFKKAGVYSPQLEQEINAGFSKVEGIQEDSKLRDAQMGGLNLLKERAQTGFSAKDRAALNQLRQQVAIDNQGKLEQIKANMAARGLSGGGNELAMQLQAASSANAEESASADRIAAQAQEAALLAAIQSGQLGGQIRGQDFDIAKTKADAADRFKLFDTQNSIARTARNTATQNQGQLYNLTEDQRIRDANTNMENAERARMEAAKRQYWQDQAQLAGMKSGAKLGQAQQYQSQADATAKMWQGIGSGVGAGAGAGLKYLGGTKPGATTDPNAHLDGTHGNAGTNPYDEDEFDPTRMRS